jgi:hypothetical protein
LPQDITLMGFKKNASEGYEALSKSQNPFS